MKPDELKPYAEFMREYELDYLEVRKADFRLVLKKGDTGIEPPVETVVEGSVPDVSAARGAARTAVRGIPVKAPLVGTFYRAQAPESPLFVDIGTAVKKGDTLCVIEAMKVMNEIKAENDGVVREILAENGKPVEYGQVLFILQL